MESDIESLKNNQQDTKPPKGKNGGARPGAGRPKGKLNKLNEQRQKAKKRFIERVNKMVDELFNAQASIAKGVSYLYRVDKDDKGKDMEAVLVTDPGEIKSYIDGAGDEDSYYYITTERPDNRALDSMLNRAFGKPEEHIDLTSLGERLVEAPKIRSTIKARDADPEDQATTGN
jgi:hypothetical protein